MAGVDYSGIMDGIRAALVADATLIAANAKVHVEEEFSWDMADGPQVYIYFDSRTASAKDQSLSRGQRTRFQLNVTIWVKAVSLDSFKVAADARNALLSLVEVALMQDHTFGLPTKIQTSWLDGGQALSAKGPASTGGMVFASAAEIRLVVEALSSTV